MQVLTDLRGLPQ